LRSGRFTALVIALVVVFAAARDLSAHRRDELLQAARVAIAPDRIELQLDLTAGIDLAEAIIARIDGDRDGVLTETENAAYVSTVMSSIEMRLDGNPIQLPSPSIEIPDAPSLRSGDGTIRLRSTIELPELRDGAHAVSFRNGHAKESSVYLANALSPADHRIAIAKQTRSADQQSVTIDFTVGAERYAPMPLWLFGSAAIAWIVLRSRG
jgi:hypothetical protein